LVRAEPGERGRVGSLGENRYRIHPLGKAVWGCWFRGDKLPPEGERCESGRGVKPAGPEGGEEAGRGSEPEDKNRMGQRLDRDRKSKHPEGARRGESYTTSLL